MKGKNFTDRDDVLDACRAIEVIERDEPSVKLVFVVNARPDDDPRSRGAWAVAQAVEEICSLGAVAITTHGMWQALEQTQSDACDAQQVWDEIRTTKGLIEHVALGRRVSADGR